MKISRNIGRPFLTTVLVIATPFVVAFKVFAAEPVPPSPAIHKPVDADSTKKSREGVKNGWYWYKTVKKKTEEKKDKDETPRPNPWTAPAGEFRKMLKDALDRAVTEPTVENVTRYVELQDIARKKALAFTNVFQLVVQANPQYNTASQYPTITPGIKALHVMRREEVSACIDQAAGDFALIYFYRPDCRFCMVQDKILAFFTDRRSWTVKKVNLYENPDAALRFNVATVPYIMLVSRETGEYMPVSVGVISLNDLEDRLCRTVKFMRGEITPEQFSLYDFQIGGPGDPATTGIYRFFDEAGYDGEGSR